VLKQDKSALGGFIRILKPIFPVFFFLGCKNFIKFMYHFTELLAKLLAKNYDTVERFWGILGV